jgi:DNA replication protein DnaC
MTMSQLINELRELKLSAMAIGVEELRKSQLNQNLSFEEQLELLVHAELTGRKSRRVNRMLQSSNLKLGVRMEDVEYDEKRGLKKDLYLNLMRLDFMMHHQNIVITGATGCGKTHLACAIGNKACTEGYRVKFVKLPVFLEELQLSHTQGGFMKLMHQLMNIDLLILDDFGITPINELQRHDLLTIIDDRYKLKSTIFTSQLPIKSWHKYLAEPTLADAILDRVLSQTLRITLRGESMRWKDKIMTDEEKIELIKDPVKDISNNFNFQEN